MIKCLLFILSLMPCTVALLERIKSENSLRSFLYFFIGTFGKTPV